MSLTVDPIWSWPLIAAAAVGLLALVLATYPARIRHLSPWHRRALLGLRLVAVALLILAMLKPAVQWEETDSDRSTLMLFSDASRSMTTTDSAGQQSRRKALLETLADAEDQLEAVAEDVDVEHYDFAAESKPVEAPSETAEGDQTALGETLDSVLRETQSRRVAGVILLSDGAQRARPPYDADPRAKARQLGEQGIPVYTVGFGGSGLSDTAFDLAVEDMVVDPVVFEKKTVPVNVQVRALGAAGRDLTVRLLVEDRSGKRPGEAGEMKVPSATRNAKTAVQIQPGRNSEVIPVELSYVPQQPGEFKIAVEVVPLDGELKTTNNRKETIITVQRGGIRVAYFDQIRAEQKFIGLLNRSEQIQLDFVPVYAGRMSALTNIDAEMFESGNYDAYIIGDVPAEVFGPRLLQDLADRIDEGAGFLMIGGVRSFGPGGYAETPLAGFLPVAMSPLEVQRGNDAAADLHHTGLMKMVPTQTGLRQFIMRLAPSGENMQRWQELPPLDGANRLRKKNDFVQVLAETPEGAPLLFAHESGQARVAAFAGDTTWQWVLGGHGEAHQRFWRQMILWLCKKEQEGDQAVWVRVEPRNFAPEQQVPLTFGARDEEGQPIPDADFAVEVTDPDSRTHQVPPRQNEEKHSAVFADTQQPGDYWVRVSAEKDGEALGFDAWTRFIVDRRDLEMDNPAADVALLEEIAALSGGLYLPPEQLKSFLQRKLQQGGFSTGEISQVQRMTLWDNWSFLLAFVGVMSLEWLLRKRRGLV